MKKEYITPTIHRIETLRLETEMLAGSVVTEDTTVETAGQKVEERNMSGAEFNHTWV